ncbi:hypothetical protein TorRG33x02_289350 [Trema orientale]|uniref:Uncharacterized protein n=1 Tax=Trema orientale TaxID=63057 RepID=A0A2P5CDC8_TREOI|nr:hypothetical protein TorRG33x02_289350 [Trema orientale]
MLFWKNRFRISVFENRDTRKQLSELALEHGHALGSNAAPPRTEVVLARTFSAEAEAEAEAAAAAVVVVVVVVRMRFGK